MATGVRVKEAWQCAISYALSMCRSGPAVKGGISVVHYTATRYELAVVPQQNWHRPCIKSCHDGDKVKNHGEWLWYAIL
jgi:hypothetical protein